MGYKNQHEYELGAINFWKSGIGKLYYSSAKDKYYRYNETKMKGKKLYEL